MAIKAIKEHVFSVSEESNGAIRGKIPTALAKELNAAGGSMIMIQTQGRLIIGGKALTEKEAAQYRKAPKAAPVAPKAKTKPSPVVGKAPAKKTKQAPAKPETSKRKTKVVYEEPAAPVGAKKKKVSFKKKA